MNPDLVTVSKQPKNTAGIIFSPNVSLDIDKLRVIDSNGIITYNVDEIIEMGSEVLRSYKERREHLDDLIEEHLDEAPGGNVVQTLHDGPGILDDYRQSSWGVERICLDGFQNHLPADSKGTRCYLHFLIDDKWVTRDEALKHKSKIKAVRFADNGVGFTPDNLFYMHSTKTSEDFSAGQFGEGMKLASIASVNLGLDLEFQSRNWRAFARGEEKKITNTRRNDATESHKKLVYDVEVYDGKPIVGSRTIFRNPSKEFIDYALTLPENELGGIKPLYKSPDGDIVDTLYGGKAFVKEIYLRDIPTVFSYNFNDANVNPDRNDFNRFIYECSIYILLGNLEDKAIIIKLLKKMKEYSDEEAKKGLYTLGYVNIFPRDCCTEFLNPTDISYYIQKENKALWKEAFEEVFGEVNTKKGEVKSAVLKTKDFDVPQYMQDVLKDYKVVTLPENWNEFFKSVGVLSDKDIVPEYIEEKIPTSITLDYGKQIWGTQRIVLDACQNHLPSDSKGTNIFLRFQTKDGEWHDYREMKKYPDNSIVKVKITDDGIGYDYKNLGLFSSGK